MQGEKANANQKQREAKVFYGILGFTEEVSILRILPLSPLNHSIANEVDCCIAIIVTYLPNP